MTARVNLGLLKRVRKVVAERLWDVAHWLYPYAEFKHDGEDIHVWETSLMFEATEAEAHKAFDRMNDALCPVEGHHSLAPCIFVVGGMHMAEKLCDCEEDERRWEFHSRSDDKDVYRCSNCELRVAQ